MTLAFWTKRFWKQQFWLDKSKPQRRKLNMGGKKGRYVVTAYKPCPICGSCKARERGKGDDYYYKCLKCGNKFR